MTLQQFIDFLKITPNNIFNINVYDEEDLGKVDLAKPKDGEFYLNMISNKSLNSEIKEIYFTEEQADLTLWTGPKINKKGEIIK